MKKIKKPAKKRQVPYVLKLLLTFILVVVVFQVVPIDILYETGLTKKKIGPLGIDQTLHIIGFLPWMTIGWIGIWKGHPFGPPRKKMFFQALGWMLLGYVIGVLVELIQYYLPYRSFNKMDMVYNFIGVFVGSVCLLFNPYRVAVRLKRLLKI